MTVVFIALTLSAGENDSRRFRLPIGNHFAALVSVKTRAAFFILGELKSENHENM